MAFLLFIPSPAHFFMNVVNAMMVGNVVRRLSWDACMGREAGRRIVGDSPRVVFPFFVVVMPLSGGSADWRCSHKCPPGVALPDPGASTSLSCMSPHYYNHHPGLVPCLLVVQPEIQKPPCNARINSSQSCQDCAEHMCEVGE